MWVEEGSDYGASMRVAYVLTRNANPSDTCFRVKFDSPDFSASATNSQTSSFNSCPKSVYIKTGEVDEFQLNASDGTFAYHVRVTWNEIEGAGTYRVFRCTGFSDDTCGTLIGQTADHGFNDTEGEDEKKYYYRVKSCTASECSEFSEYDRGYRSESSAPPNEPTGINATDGTITDRIRVSWNDTERATRYKLYRCKSTSVSSCVYFGSATGTTYDDVITPPATTPTAETTYWYRVKACNLDNCSSHSEADTGFSGVPISGEACNEAFVQLDSTGTIFNVAPTGVDDTVNIQCALDTAVKAGIPTVRLGKSTYYISHLIVENFKGSFEGTKKTATILEVVDGSISCSRMDDSGMLAAGIKFAKGEPRVRFMTIRAFMPCRSGFLDAIVHFTGGSAQSTDCDNDVIFGVVDRVIIEGSGGRTYLRTAIAVEPEGKWLGGCKDTLLGTFKLNRSTMLNSYYGIVTSMKSGAQVDINFNEFRGNSHAISLYDTNQNTTITANKFFGENTENFDYYGVIVSNFSDNPPPTTRMVVHNNEFNIASTFTDHWSFAVSVRFDLYGSSRVISDVSSVVTSNKFNLSGGGTYGVLFWDTSNTHVSSNWFNGSGGMAIFTSGTIPVSGWTISANMGLADFTSRFVEDIQLGSNTSNCIVGPGQGASIRDDGVDNTILPQ